eukprot:4930798-Amphidinium_carterae.1
MTKAMEPLGGNELGILQKLLHRKVLSASMAWSTVRVHLSAHAAIRPCVPAVANRDCANTWPGQTS